MNTTTNQTGHDRPRCGARLRSGQKAGQPCNNPAGWGTKHPGIGRCRKHGGNTPSHTANANRQQAENAVATYGLPQNIDPRDALLQEVHRTAGHVAWLGTLVASLDHGGVGYRTEPDADGQQIYIPLSGLKQFDRAGKFEKPAVWVELYQAERRHLREVCRDAISAGIEERRVRLAEQQGELLARAVQAILGDLQLTREQWELVPQVVPGHLRAAVDVS